MRKQNAISGSKLVQRKARKPVNIDGVKYFTKKEIRLLRRTVRKEAEFALQKCQITPIREWMAIDILTCTGLRVSECSDLKVGDFRIGHGRSELFITCKGYVSGTVIAPLMLKKHLKQFLRWKAARGESIDNDTPLFVGQRGKWASQAIQQVVKKYLKLLGLYEPGKSTHALRHSYAVHLYSREKDLRTVQKQLRHVSI